RIATTATTKQKLSRRQCAGTRRRLRVVLSRIYAFFGRPTDVAVVCAVVVSCVCPGAIVLFPCEAPATVAVFVCPGATVLRRCPAGKAGVVLVRPGATVLFPCEAPATVVVFVCPGAIVLFPCRGLAAGVVFVCPGSAGLRPGPARLVFPGATMFL